MKHSNTLDLITCEWPCVCYKLPESAKIPEGYRSYFFTIINLLEIRLHIKHIHNWAHVCCKN